MLQIEAIIGFIVDCDAPDIEIEDFGEFSRDSRQDLIEVVLRVDGTGDLHDSRQLLFHLAAERLARPRLSAADLGKVVRHNLPSME